MNIKKLLFGLLLLLATLSPMSAAHFILGQVSDALDTTSADTRTVILWNPSVGTNDNLTDIIGATGNSGQPNTYMIDCELLANGCPIGDTLYIQVQNEGDDYTSERATALVTGAGFDLATEIRLNSPPEVSLFSPQTPFNFSQNVALTCNATDLDGNLDSLVLYGNWSGGWHENASSPLTGSTNSTTFSQTLSQGTYLWSCFAQDNLSIGTFATENRTIFVDTTNPSVNYFLANETQICGVTSKVRVNCSVTDDFLGIKEVTIVAQSPTETYNYSANLLSGNTYFIEPILNETGNWSFTCYARDQVNNTIAQQSTNTTVFSAAAELEIKTTHMVFNNSAPQEYEPVFITANIFNRGCADATNVLVGFYEKDPAVEVIQIGTNRTLNVGGLTNFTTNITWAAKIGTTNIFVEADIENILTEDNETNNKANKTIYVNAWQEFYGNLSSTKILGDAGFFNLSAWTNESLTTGNIFAADSESMIDWMALRAIGRDTTDTQTTNDFEDIDTIFSMNLFNDSTQNIFTTNGNTPLETNSFAIRSQTINSVPVINSTTSSNFITGILWDSSDDEGDNEFSQEDNEDLVFVTKINENTAGKYGQYDYEIRVPARLREQSTADTTDIYFYYELS